MQEDLQTTWTTPFLVGRNFFQMVKSYTPFYIHSPAEKVGHLAQSGYLEILILSTQNKMARSLTPEPASQSHHKFKGTFSIIHVPLLFRAGQGRAGQTDCYMSNTSFVLDMVLGVLTYICYIIKNLKELFTFTILILQIWQLRLKELIC